MIVVLDCLHLKALARLIAADNPVNECERLGRHERSRAMGFCDCVYRGRSDGLDYFDCKICRQTMCAPVTQ